MVVVPLPMRYHAICDRDDSEGDDSEGCQTGQGWHARAVAARWVKPFVTNCQCFDVSLFKLQVLV